MFRPAPGSGVNIDFGIAPLTGTDHPNGTLIEAETDGGESLRAVAEAVGGGGLRIKSLNDWQVDLDGKAHELLVEVEARGEAQVAELWVMSSDRRSTGACCWVFTPTVSLRPQLQFQRCGAFRESPGCGPPRLSSCSTGRSDFPER